VAGVCYLPTSLHKHPPFLPSLLSTIALPAYNSSLLGSRHLPMKRKREKEGRKEREKYTRRAKKGGRGRKK